MKHVDVKSSTYYDFINKNDKKDRKFEVDNHVRISKYKNIFVEICVPNWSEKVFAIKKIKITVPWTYVIIDLNGDEIVGTFYEKGLQRSV